jgi:hypothetical protein
MAGETPGEVVVLNGNTVEALPGKLHDVNNAINASPVNREKRNVFVLMDYLLK